MIVKFAGRDWQFEDDKCSLQQGVALHYEYGMTLMDWQEGVKRLDGRALAFTYWLMLQQNGEIKPLKGLDCNIVEFMMAYIDAKQADAEAEKQKAAAPEKAPDPTLPPSPPAGLPSPESASRTDMTLLPPVHVNGTVPESPITVS